MNKGLLTGFACLLLVAAGCGGAEEGATGGATVALSSVGPDGAVYRLQSARFRVRGASRIDFNTNDFPAESVRTFQLPPGEYEITLLGGWSLVRTAGDEHDGPVDASLTSANPVSLQVASGAATAVRFTFQVNDIDIIFEPGDLELGVDVVFPDAGVPAETTCTADEDCDDGLYCTGVATCQPNHPDADVQGCVEGLRPCTEEGQACDEVQDTCVEELACVAPLRVCESDVDCGETGSPCDGDLRCDPTHELAAPNGCVSTPRACSLAACDPVAGCQPCHVDSDCGYCDGLVCNPSSPDADASGCVATPGPTPADECRSRAGFCWERSRGGCAAFPEPARARCETDLDCGGWCNGFICDPEHANADFWGCVSGRPVFRTICAALAPSPHCLESRRACGNCNSGNPEGCDADDDGINGVLAGGTDCDDSDADRFPSNLERCDIAHDEDCNPDTVAGTEDGDSDADGRVSSACRNVVSTGPNTVSTTQGTDCDDQLGGVHLGANDVCNHRDDDCDGLVDEGSAVPLYRDADGDGFGEASCTFSGCWNDTGFVTNANDCDDTNPSLRPGTGVCTSSTRLGLCSFGELVEVTCSAGQQCRTGVDGVGRCQAGLN